MKACWTTLLQLSRFRYPKCAFEVYFSFSWQLPFFLWRLDLKILLKKKISILCYCGRIVKVDTRLGIGSDDTGTNPKLPWASMGLWKMLIPARLSPCLSWHHQFAVCSPDCHFIQPSNQEIARRYWTSVLSDLCVGIYICNLRNASMDEIPISRLQNHCTPAARGRNVCRTRASVPGSSVSPLAI